MDKEQLPEPIFLSAPKAATMCGVSRNTVCCWIRDGKLPSYRTAGGKNLIRPGDLVGFMRGSGMFVPPGLAEMAAKDEQAMGGGGSAADTSEPVAVEPAILVVDDDPGARSLAVHCLNKLNMPVLQAATGYEALHLLTEHPEIALIVLDLVMPGQHGGETFMEIRKQNKMMPVIVVTGFPPDEHEKVFGEYKPDMVLPKPYKPEDLVRAAESYMAEIGI